MERQDSFGSLSSGGLALSDKSDNAKVVKNGEKGEGLEGQNPPWLVALFGVLYTLAKEKFSDSDRIAIFTILLDFILLFGLFLVPEYPWHADPNLWIFKVFYYIEFHLPIAHAGYTFYLAIFYILVSILFGSVAILIWVGWCFKNDNFPFLWPIKVARIVVSVFVSMFYIASLNIFLIALQCDVNTWKHHIYGCDCLKPPHLIHAVFSAISCITFFGLAVLLVVADHELEPMSRSLLAAPHSMCELRQLLLKTAITVADILLRPYPHVQVMVYCICCGLMLFYQVRMVPYYTAWINCLRAGLNGVLAWVTLWLCILQFRVEQVDAGDSGHRRSLLMPVHAMDWEPHSVRYALTVIMSVGVPFAFAGSAAAAYWQIWRLWLVGLKFRGVDLTAVKPRTVYRFSTDFDVEVASRVGRVWDEDFNVDQRAVEIAENVLKAGVAMMPNSPFAHIAYSNFLIDVKHNIPAGWSQLEAARKLELNLSYQFSIFSREQEHKQKAAAGSSGEQSVDLVSYVEFQKNYRNLLVYHKAALTATRDFWRLLMKEQVDLQALSGSFRRIDEMERLAETTYKLVLERYPKSVQLLRSYGTFLEGVKNDPWAAARYFGEADKQEELAESNTAALGAADLNLLDGVDHGALLAQVNDKNSAVVTINALGIIQMANKNAIKMMGYKKGELEGKNVSCLMPQPFSQRHNGYLKAYVNGGKANIIDQMREVVALHKDSYVFPINLFVTRISGTGMDSMFMGVIKPATIDPGVVKMWVNTNGIILCADQQFVDLAGWSPSELVGRAFSCIGMDPAELDRLVSDVARYSEAHLATGAVTRDTFIRHKYGQDVRVHIKVEMGGSDSQRLLVVTMVPASESAGMMMAVDKKGRILYANATLAAALGYKPSVLKSLDLQTLLPQPVGLMHSTWLKDADMAAVAKPPPGSCRAAGATVAMRSANGTLLHVRLRITARDSTGLIGSSSGTFARGAASAATDAGDVIYSVKVERSSAETSQDERCLALTVDADGVIVSASSGTPTSLYGVNAAGLVGQPLDALVDAFAEWRKAGNNLSHGLAALLVRAVAHPGTSWRVGVGALSEEAQAAAAARTNALLRSSSYHDRHIKAAVMSVRLDEEKLQEAGDDAASDSVTVTVKLWRADMMSGVLELNPGCSVAKADEATGGIFGCAGGAMLGASLRRYLEVPENCTLESLMGRGTGSKKGKDGANKAVVAAGAAAASGGAAIGPRKTVVGMHSDGRSLSISMQATLKDGTNAQRLVVMLKALQPLKAPAGLIAAVVAQNEAADMEEVVSGNDREDLYATGNTATNNNGGLAATSRGVELEMMATQRAPLKAMASRVLSRMRTSQLEKGQQEDGKTSGVYGREGTGIASIISEEPSGRKARFGSSTSQRTLTEAELEQRAARKSAQKAKEWLEAGYGASQRYDDDATGANGLPGALLGPDAANMPLGLLNPEPSDAAAAAAAGGDDAGRGLDGGLDGGSEGGDSAAVALNFSRGKRLRKLLRLLNGKAAMQTITSFRLKMYLLLLGLILAHVAFFAVIIVFLVQERSIIQDIDAGGQVMDVLHRSLIATRVLDASQRGAGFNTSDVAAYATALSADLDDMEALHQGIYLGFNKLKSIGDSSITSLWTNSNLNVTMYGDDGTASTTAESLFTLGSDFISAGREVAHRAQAAATSGNYSALLSDTRYFQFMHGNGPTVLYDAYLHSLNFMLLHAQGSVKLLQLVLLTLLVVEGALIVLGACTYIMALLIKVARHRSALFTVFLTVPNGFLRLLASKSVSLVEEGHAEEEKDTKKAAGGQSGAFGDPEEEQEGFASYGARTSFDANANKQQRRSMDGYARKAADPYSRRSVEASGPSASARRSQNGHAAAGPRGSVAGQQSGSGGTRSRRMSSVAKGITYEEQGVQGKGKMARMGAVLRGAYSTKALFNGKSLTNSAHDIVRLIWPFVAWGALVVLLYGISFGSFNSMDSNLVAIKLARRAVAQESRVVYYAVEAALGRDIAAVPGLQASLTAEADMLEKVWELMLYGGPTLPDAAADGAKEDSRGFLFTAAAHADLAFKDRSCLRADTSQCFGPTSPYYQVTHNAVEPMVRRVIDEARLMALDAPASVTYNSTRYQALWAIGYQDLHDGLTTYAHTFDTDATSAFDGQRILHVVLLVVCLLAFVAFAVVMLKPYIAHISKESRRVAELLVQLPPEMDVEGMVEASWKAVMQKRLVESESGSSFGVDSLASMLGRAVSNVLSCCMGGRSRLPNGATATDVLKPTQQQQRATAVLPIHKGHVGGDSLARAQGRPQIVPRLTGSIGKDAGEKLFTPRASAPGTPTGPGRMFGNNDSLRRSIGNEAGSPRHSAPGTPTGPAGRMFGNSDSVRHSGNHSGAFGPDRVFGNNDSLRRSIGQEAGSPRYSAPGTPTGPGSLSGEHSGNYGARPTSGNNSMRHSGNHSGAFGPGRAAGDNSMRHSGNHSGAVGPGPVFGDSSMRHSGNHSAAFGDHAAVDMAQPAGEPPLSTQASLRRRRSLATVVPVDQDDLV